LFTNIPVLLNILEKGAQQLLINNFRKMIIGSSLGKRFIPWVLEENFLIFSGKIKLEVIEKNLRKCNKKSIDRIVLMTGNDLYPSKNCGTHKCLSKFDMDECMETYMKLLDLLFLFTSEVRIVEPPPRCRAPMLMTKCMFFSIATSNRFPNLIRKLKESRSGEVNVLGVVSNKVIMQYMGTQNPWKLVSKDGTHFNDEANKILKIILY